MKINTEVIHKVRRGKLTVTRTHSTRQGRGREERLGENTQWTIALNHPYSYQYITLDEEELAALNVLLAEISTETSTDENP
jgi:hypothetical protein